MRVSIASPHVRPSPNDRRVGIRIRTFEACSGFTFVTADRIAQRPTAAFVAGLRPNQLPGRAACQLPDQSTIIRVRSSLTDSSRPRGARSFASVWRCPSHFRFTPHSRRSLRGSARQLSKGNLAVCRDCATMRLSQTWADRTPQKFRCIATRYGRLAHGVPRRRLSLRYPVLLVDSRLEVAIVSY